MSAIDQIVQITISQLTQAVPQVGFGIPLILGDSNVFDETYKAYTSPAGMLSDGFTTSDAEYIHAVELCSQELSPIQFLVGKRSTPVAQVDTITPVAVDAHHYIVTIDDVEYDYLSGGSATAAQIVTGLKALINADSDAAVTASGTTTLILTADVAGAAFITSINADANMTLVHTTASNGVVDDIAAVIAENNNWYGLILTSKTNADILQAAAYIETLKKIYICASNNASIPTSATDDIATTLKGRGYKRTGMLYHGAPSTGPDAAWVGGQLPQTPGASTWKFKELVGIDPSVLSESVRTILIGIPGVPGKNVNIYETVGGANITEEGFMVGGQFIDITVGIDWLESTIQTNVFSALQSAPKVPYTDQGAAVIENAIRAAIVEGIGNGLIDGDTEYEVSVPPVLSVSTNNRANRILPDVTFNCRLAGAFHFIQIAGVVTV